MAIRSAKKSRGGRWFFVSLLVVPFLLVVIGVELNMNSIQAWEGEPVFPQITPFLEFGGGLGLYNPVYYLVMILKCLSQSYHIETFVQSGQVGFAFIVAAALYIVIGTLIRRRAISEGFHGSARLGTDSDLRKAGLLVRKPTGIVLGLTGDAYYKSRVDQASGKRVVERLVKPGHLITAPRDTSVMVMSQPRTGKTVGIVAPTILNWPDSAVINDPKGELYKATAGFRSLLGPVFVLRLREKGGDGYNPIFDIREGEAAFSDATSIAAELVEGSGRSKGGDDATAHFNAKAIDMLATIFLYLAFSRTVPLESKNIPGAFRLLSGLGVNEDEEDSRTVQGSSQALSIMATGEFDNAQTRKHVRAGISRAKESNDRERASMFSTLFKAIRPFEDPLLAENVSYSSFSVEDFLQTSEPMTLYITVPASFTDQAAPFSRVFYAMLMNRVSEQTTISTSKKALKRDMLCVLEELPSMGHFAILPKRMGLIPGFGVTFLLVAQGNEQLQELYGNRHPFFSLCATWVSFTTADQNTAELIQKRAGVVSEEKVSRGVSGRGASLSRSEQAADTQKNLINADEAMTLDFDKSFIVPLGTPIYVASKIYCFADPRFAPYMDLPIQEPGEPRQPRPSNLGARWSYVKESGWYQQEQREPVVTFDEQLANAEAHKQLMRIEEQQMEQHLRKEYPESSVSREGEDGIDSYKEMMRNAW